jgi:hypothetical protein
VTEYASGAEVLTEARLRRQGLGPEAGILIVEGRDDYRLVNRVCISPAHVLPAGAKRKVLEAAEKLRADEDQEFVLLVDCDYDVPAGDLQGLPHLILTEHPDADTDMVGLGVLEQVVLHAVPSAANSEEELNAVTAVVFERAVALASAVGQFRQVSRVENLMLDFKELRFRKARKKGSAEVDLLKLSRMLLHRVGSTEKPSDLCALAEGIPAGLMTCNGHDLIESVRNVLREDFGVQRDVVTGIDKLFRACAGEPLFIERWSVIARIQAWQESTGRKVLRN